MEDIKSASHKRSISRKPRGPAEKRPCMDPLANLPTAMLLLKGTSAPYPEGIHITTGVEVIEISSPSPPVSALALPVSPISL